MSTGAQWSLALDLSPRPGACGQLRKGRESRHGCAHMHVPGALESGSQSALWPRRGSKPKQRRRKRESDVTVHPCSAHHSALLVGQLLCPRPRAGHRAYGGDCTLSLRRTQSRAQTSINHKHTSKCKMATRLRTCARMSPGCHKQPAMMGTEVHDRLSPEVKEPGVASSEPGPQGAWHKERRG